MKRKPIYYRISPLTPTWCQAVVLCGISSRFQLLSRCNSQIAHALLTRPPLRSCQHKDSCLKHLNQPERKFFTEKFSLSLSAFSKTFVLTTSPFDLHVWSTPPAFVLSQDQTLMFYEILSEKSQTFQAKSSKTYFLKFTSKNMLNFSLTISLHSTQKCFRSLSIFQWRVIQLSLSPSHLSGRRLGRETNGIAVRSLRPCPR